MSTNSIWSAECDTALARAMAVEGKGLRKGEQRPRSFWVKVSARVYAETGEYLSAQRCSSRFQYLRMRAVRAQEREDARPRPVAAAPVQARPRPGFEQRLLVKLARQGERLDALTRVCSQMRLAVEALAQAYLPADTSAEPQTEQPQIQIQDLAAPAAEQPSASA